MAPPGPTPPGPRELTGIVDLTRGEDHPTARLLDLVPGRSGTVYKNWLEERGEEFRSGIQIATLDPFQGYKNAIDDQLQDTTSVLDAFHIVKLAGDALDEVRRRVQQDTTGHRGRKGDPLYQIRLLLRASRDRLTKRQKERLREAFTADEAHISVEVAYLHRASPRRLPSRHTRPRPTPGRSSHREPTKVFHPRDRSPGPDPTQVEGRLLGLLRYRRSQQRANRSHQRNHRAGQTRRQRLPQPHQLQTPNAPHRRRPRRLHPHSTLKSRFSSVPLLNEAYVPIVGGIQRPDRDTSAVLLAVPRGSLSDRLSCLRTQLPRGLCAPRIRIVGIATSVSVVERSPDRRACIPAPSGGHHRECGSANSHADSPSLVPSYGT